MFEIATLQHIFVGDAKWRRDISKHAIPPIHAGLFGFKKSSLLSEFYFGSGPSLEAKGLRSKHLHSASAFLSFFPTSNKSFKFGDPTETQVFKLTTPTETHLFQQVSNVTGDFQPSGKPSAEGGLSTTQDGDDQRGEEEIRQQNAPEQPGTADPPRDTTGVA